jgi:hypothetical protein
MKTTIINKNDKGERHGYQEEYYSDGKLAYRGNSKNNIDVGYQEYHYLNETEYYIQ